MKALASLLTVVGLVLGTIASNGAAAADTNEPALSPQANVPHSTNGPARSIQSSSSEQSLSRSSAEILQLIQAGMDEGVLISFIDGSGWFLLSADHIVYLSDLGVPSRVIQAMLAHDADRLAKLEAATNSTNVSASARERSSLESLTEHAQEPVVAGVVAQRPKPPLNLPAAAQLGIGVVKQDAEKLGRPPAAPAKRRVLYPVREPYPVELTAPIVFLDAPTF